MTEIINPENGTFGISLVKNEQKVRVTKINVCVITRNREWMDYRFPREQLRIVSSPIIFEDFESFEDHRRSLEPNILLVNIDELGDLDSSVNSLVSFRSNAPEVPIIILSSDFQRSEPADHRRMICDFSMRVPFSDRALYEAIQTVIMMHEDLNTNEDGRA